MPVTELSTEQEIQFIHIVKEVRIAAPPEVVFEAIIEEIGPGSELPDGKPFPMKIERVPGGRWYRDLGGEAGHLWGHVQVIKAPTLLELTGPLFMSFPAVNHLQYKLKLDGNDTVLKLTHRAFGLIPEEHRKGVHMGWDHAVSRIQIIAEKMLKDRSRV